MLLACLGGLLAACGDSGDASSKGDDTAAVYSAILGKVLADEPPTTTTAAASTSRGGATTTTVAGAEQPDDDGSGATTMTEPEPDDPTSTTEVPAEELPTVFVEPLGDGFVIDLRVQAKVVSNLEAVAEVRFIDDRIEAVDTDEPGRPVKPNGLLVGLGPLVQASETERTVQVRRYVDDRHHVDRLATVTASGASWTVVLSDER